MKKEIQFTLFLLAICSMSLTCKKQKSTNPPPVLSLDTSLVNLAHLNYLYTPVTFADGTAAAGIYIYAEAPDYRLTDAAGEGYTCVDDVSRAALVYLRSSNYLTDTAIQSKAFKLISFLLEMQSSNGYFYNFLLTGNQINTNGITSVNNAGWWSWRALQTLTEETRLVKMKNPQLADKMEVAVNRLVAALKKDLVNIPQTTKTVSGIVVPEWLPAGSGTDQAALLIIGLIPYCASTGDTLISAYIQKLADGILLMQHGDATHFPYGAFLSWENTWHAYGNDQAYALLKAGTFFNDSNYILSGLKEINNFYPWLLNNGPKSSFTISDNGNGLQPGNEKSFEQIAYGIRPIVFAAIEAYRLTGDEKYSDMAAQFAAWFFGNNVMKKNMYSTATGRCYDAIASATYLNINSGAESTIEALLTMEKIESYPAIKKAMDKYKK